jgi:hypothetical protein
MHNSALKKKIQILAIFCYTVAKGRPDISKEVPLDPVLQGPMESRSMLDKRFFIYLFSNRGPFPTVFLAQFYSYYCCHYLMLFLKMV